VKFIVLFEDDPAVGADVRRRHMAEHLAFLERHATEVQAAGPLKSSDGQGAGGLWLVEVTDPSEVETLVKDDPLWSTGLRKSVRILVWNQVCADGHRRV